MRGFGVNRELTRSLLAADAATEDVLDRCRTRKLRPALNRDFVSMALDRKLVEFELTRAFGAVALMSLEVKEPQRGGVAMLLHADGLDDILGNVDARWILCHRREDALPAVNHVHDVH
ncbi:MAG: hypothetical protein WD200_04810 [Candidatus Andersenbacteria bacterium]